MKKQFLNLGKALNKAEQKLINGGFGECNLPEQYIVTDCSQCKNTILPGAPVFCHGTCCTMAI